MKRYGVLLSAGWLIFSSACKQSDYLYPKRDRRVVKEVHEVARGAFKDKIDMLWVIDNSESMDDDQKAVIENTSRFIDAFTKKNQNDKLIKWRIGLISTDPRELPYVGFQPNDKLDHTTPNPVAKFQGAVGRLGIDGSGQEASFFPTEIVMRDYPDFLREDALFAMIILSDEDDQSDDYQPEKNYPVSRFVMALDQWKGNLDNVAVYAALGMQDDCGPFPYDPKFCPLCYEGSRYQEFVRAIHGTKYLLCRDDFGTMLSEIGRDIVDRLLNLRVTLKGRPIVSTLKVKYQNREIPSGSAENGGYWYFDYERNQVVFHDSSFFNAHHRQIEFYFEVGN